MADPDWRKRLTPWKPGQSGNPSGKPKGLLTRQQVETTFKRFHDKTLEELEAVVNDKKSTILERMLCSVMIKAIEEGDINRFGFLLDRAIGKVPNVVDVSQEELLRKELSEMSDAEVKQLARQELLNEGTMDVQHSEPKPIETKADFE